MKYWRIMPSAERFSSRFHSCPRSVASGLCSSVHFTDNLVSGLFHYPPIYQPPREVYFNTKYLILNISVRPNIIMVNGRISNFPSKPAATKNGTGTGPKYKWIHPLFITVSVLEWQRPVLLLWSRSFSRSQGKMFCAAVDVQLLLKLTFRSFTTNRQSLWI